MAQLPVTVRAVDALLSPHGVLLGELSGSQRAARALVATLATAFLALVVVGLVLEFMGQTPAVPPWGRCCLRRHIARRWPFLG